MKNKLLKLATFYALSAGIVIGLKKLCGMKLIDSLVESDGTKARFEEAQNSGEAGAIGIIGGADGPTAVFISKKAGDKNSDGELSGKSNFYLEAVIFLGKVQQVMGITYIKDLIRRFKK